MIKFSHVYKTYPRNIGQSPECKALKGVSFSLKKGDTLGLIGQNGAGKSTTIRLIMGYIKANEGEVTILGNEGVSPSVLRRIGYLPEKSTFPANLTCVELLSFAGKCCNMDKNQIKQRTELLTKKLGIWLVKDRRLSQYSKGMQQRASFAAALIHDPELLILDEPMSGLDPIGRAEIIDLIRELQNDEKSILFCSHLLDDVERITDKVAILHQGELLFNGGINDLCKGDGWKLELNSGELISAKTQNDIPKLVATHSDTIVGVKSGKESLQEAFVRVVSQSE